MLNKTETQYFEYKTCKLLVNLNNRIKDINTVKCDIKRNYCSCNKE